MNLQRLKNKKIAVAVSGGADSVALLHCLKGERENYGFTLLALHCEHGIRGEESLRDMRFTEALCKAWDIPLRIFKEDCPQKAKREKVSLETAARRFRYECFDALLKDGEVDYIATAHHSGDEAETVLFRLARGSGLLGASGIKEERSGYIRPFLNKSKGEILAYIRKNGLDFCEDSTNLEPDATRNKLRLEVLPRLEEAVPGAAENLARFARLAAEDDELLTRLSRSLLTEKEGVPLVQFSDEKPLFSRACLAAMKALGLERDYESTHLAALFDLQKLERGAVVTLPKKIRARKEKEGILFFGKKEEERFELSEEKDFSLEGYDGGRYGVKLDFAPPKEETGLCVLRIDLDKLPPAARFRFRKEGDFICSFGGGKKSLKKFFNEKEIPVKERGCLPLLATEDGEVYAVCGVEISKKLAVENGTKRTAYMTTRKREKKDGETP